MTDAAAWFDQAKKAVKEEAVETPTFKFEEEGDTLQGVFIKAEVASTSNGIGLLLVVKPVGMEEVETDENGFVKTWVSTTLRRLVFDAMPKQGSLILIEYVESRDSERNPGRSYKVFGLQASEMDPNYWAGIATKTKTKKGLSDALDDSSSSSVAGVFDESPF